MIYAFGDCKIDTTRFELSRGAQIVAVEPQVLELLMLLIDHRDRAMTRDELFETVWKGRVVSDTTLSSRIKSARQAIGDDGTSQRYIKTIHGRGFRFIGDVEVLPGKPATPQTPGQRPATRYARSGEVHVAYQLFGDGPANLVLTPGFVSHIDNYWDEQLLSRWLHQLGALARVAMFDKRGTGMSDRVNALPGMDERMDDVRAVLDAVQFDTAYIMGISEGGSLATLFAAHHPERCDGLVLYGAFARFRHWFPDAASLQALFDYIRSDWGSGNSIPGFAPSMADAPDYRDWWGRFERLGATPGAAITLMEMNSKIDIFDVLPSVHVPTLVIHRADDVLIDVAAGRELAGHIPGARYLEIAGKDHLPWVANSDEIVAAVRDFVRAGREQVTDRVLATVVLIRLGKWRGGVDEQGESLIRREASRFRATRTEASRSGTIVTFDGPTRAIEFAISISGALRLSNVESRIGIHTGEVGRKTGAADSVAARIAADICNNAREGQVLLTRTVGDLVAGSGILLNDRGKLHLSAIEADWQLLEATAKRN